VDKEIWQTRIDRTNKSDELRRVLDLTARLTQQ
jgi:hypothetical protein